MASEEAGGQRLPPRARDGLPKRINGRLRGVRSQPRFAPPRALTHAAAFCGARRASGWTLLALLCVVAWVCAFGLPFAQRRGGLGLGCQAFIKTATSTMTG